jgi:hypothetical protein
MAAFGCRQTSNCAKGSQITTVGLTPQPERSPGAGRGVPLRFPREHSDNRAETERGGTQRRRASARRMSDETPVDHCRRCSRSPRLPKHCDAVSDRSTSPLAQEPWRRGDDRQQSGDA